MAEATFLAGLHLAGYAAILPARRSLPPTARALLAFPTGLALYVLAAWLLLLVDGYSVVAVVALVSLAAITIGLRTGRTAELPGSELVTAGLAFVGIFGLAVVLQEAVLTRLTPDSFRYLQMGSIIQQTGSVDAAEGFILVDRPVAVPLMHAPAGAMSDGIYLRSVIPVLGLTGIAAFAAMAAAIGRNLGASTWRLGGVIGAAIVFLFLTDRVVYNLFYINGHMAFAVYLALVAAAVWLARRRDDQSLALLAVPWLGVLALLRPEAIIVLALVLVPVALEERLALSTRWALVGAPVTATLVWYGGVVGSRVGGFGEERLVDVSVAIAVGLLVLVAAMSLRRPRIHQVARIAPVTMLVGLVAFGLWMYTRAPDDVRGTLSATWENITGAGRWGWTWLIIPVLVAIALLIVRLDWWQLWVTPIVGYPLVLLAVTFDRGSARIGTGDSTNRLLMHILLFVLLYLVVAAARAHTDNSRCPAAGDFCSD